MKKMFLAPVVILLVFVLFGFGAVSQTDTGAISQTHAEPFCGTSTYGECSAASDCVTDDCSGSVCRSINEEPISGSCEWRDCYKNESYSMTCGCLDGKCQWFQEAHICKGEGESIPVIASPPECCAGLTLIPPTEQNLVGISGYCTANCGDGVCEGIETAYNCPVDCAGGGPVCGNGACEGAWEEQNCLEDCEVASPKLVAFWKFEGSARDSSGNGHNGYVRGSIPVTGVSGQAYWFDGVDDSIYFGDILDNEIRNAFTIGAWIKLDEGALKKTHNYVFWKNDDRPGIRVSNGKVMFTNWQDSAGCCMTSSSALQEGKWYYLTQVFDGNKFTGYINGDFEASQLNTANYSPGGSILIGGDEKVEYYDRHFKGIIDEVKIWNYALSASQIKEEYASVDSDNPCTCQAIYAPVCGVDGETYSNSCVASCAGVGVAYEGECSAETIKIELGQEFKLQENQTAMLLENGRSIGISITLNRINYAKCEEGMKCAFLPSVEVEVTQASGDIATGTTVYLTPGQSTKVFGITLTNLEIDSSSAVFVAKKEAVPELIKANLGEKFKIIENQTALVQKKNETVMKLRFEGIVMATCAGGGGSGVSGGSATATSAGGSGSATTSSSAGGGGSGVAPTCYGGEKYAQFNISFANDGVQYVSLREGQSTESNGYRITLGYLSYSNGKYSANMLVEETFNPETVIAYLGKPFGLIEGQKAIIKETRLQLKLIELDNDTALLEVSQPVTVEPSPGAGGSGGGVAAPSAGGSGGGASTGAAVLPVATQAVSTQLTAVQKAEIVEAVKVSTEQGNVIRSPYIKLRVGEEQTVYGHKIRFNVIAAVDCAAGSDCLSGDVASFTVTRAEEPVVKTVYLDQKFDLVENQTAIVLNGRMQEARKLGEAMRVKLLGISLPSCDEPEVGEKETESICDGRPMVKVEVQLPAECAPCECPTCKPCECPISSSVPSGTCECPSCGPCSCPACGGTAALLVLREGEERMIGGYALRLLDVSGNKAVFIVKKSSISDVIKVKLDEEFKLQQKQTALVVEESLYMRLEGVEIVRCGSAETRCVGGSFASVSVWKEYYKNESYNGGSEVQIAVYKIREGESLDLYGVKISLLGLDSYGKSAKFVVTKESERVINVHTNEPFKLQLRQAARVLEANMRIDLLNISELPIQCIRAPCINPMQVEISVSNYLFSNEATGKAVSSSDYIETVVEETVASEDSGEVAVPVPPMPFQTFVLSEGESVEVNDFVIKLVAIGSAESAEFIVTKKGSGEKLFIELVNGWNLFSIPGQLDVIDSKECDSGNMKVFEYLPKEKRFVDATSTGGGVGKAYWVFNSGNKCHVNAIVRGAVPMSQLDGLVVGWNFVPVTVDMIGSKIMDIGKECSPKAAYFYNANSKKWQNAMDKDISASDLGKAFALYATKACSLGGELTPPMPPLPEGG